MPLLPGRTDSRPPRSGIHRFQGPCLVIPRWGWIARHNSPRPDRLGVSHSTRHQRVACPAVRSQQSPGDPAHASRGDSCHSLRRANRRCATAVLPGYYCGREHTDRRLFVLKGSSQHRREVGSIAFGDKTESIELFVLASVEDDIKQRADEVRMLKSQAVIEDCVVQQLKSCQIRATSPRGFGGGAGFGSARLWAARHEQHSGNGEAQAHQIPAIAITALRPKCTVEYERVSRRWAASARNSPPCKHSRPNTNDIDHALQDLGPERCLSSASRGGAIKLPSREPIIP